MDKEDAQKIVISILKNCHEAVGLIRQGKRSYEEALELLGALAMFNEGEVEEDKSQAITIPPPPPTEEYILVESRQPREREREDETVLLD